MKKSFGLGFAQSCGVMIVAQLILTGIATHFASLSVRPLVMMSLTAVSMMVIAAQLGIPRKPKLTAIILSTAISVVCVYWWRRLVDPTEFVGPVPASLEIPALAISTVLAVLFGAIVAIVSNSDSRLYRFRWTFVILFSIMVVGGLIALSASRLNTPSTMRMQLKQVLESEAHLDSSSPFERQQLSFWLGVFGRGSEAQAFSTLSARPYARGEHPSEVSAKWEQGIPSTAFEWRQAISEIAARQ